GERGGVIKALQRGDGCFELNLLAAGDRLLRGNRVQPGTDGCADVRHLGERLIDVVDRITQRIIQSGRGAGPGLQRGHEILYRRENTLVAARGDRERISGGRLPIESHLYAAEGDRR